MRSACASVFMMRSNGGRGTLPHTLVVRRIIVVVDVADRMLAEMSVSNVI